MAQLQVLGQGGPTWLSHLSGSLTCVDSLTLSQAHSAAALPLRDYCHPSTTNNRKAQACRCMNTVAEAAKTHPIRMCMRTLEGGI